MTTENKAVVILRGKGKSEILFRHTYGTLKISHSSHFLLTMRVTHQRHLSLAVDSPPDSAQHQGNTIPDQNCPKIKK